MAFRDIVASGTAAARVSTAEAVAFRLTAHHLTERLGEASLLKAAGACAVQNSPPGSALLALHARVEDVTADGIARAVGEEKRLLQTWCMRGAPFYFPTADATVFTTGALPATEAGRRHLILGVEQALDRLGLGLDEVIGLVKDELRAVLSGKRLAITELGAELAVQVAAKLPSAQRDAWHSEGPYAAGQPLGEAVTHFCIRVLTLRGLVCLAPRSANTAPFTLVDEWLGHPLPDIAPEVARAELLRRYLRCYGPSTPKDFAAWVGVAVGDTGPWWDTVVEELVPVEFAGRRAWLLTDDLDALRSPSVPSGVRLLPPRDPYTQARDRETLIAKPYHRELWKPLGDPGAVLADGDIVGAWRARKNGQRLTITVTAFAVLTRQHQAQLADEAERVASLRAVSLARLDICDHSS